MSRLTGRNYFNINLRLAFRLMKIPFGHAPSHATRRSCRVAIACAALEKDMKNDAKYFLILINFT